MSGDSGSAAPSDEPSAALGGAWHLLDALPRSAAAPSMTSTTVEMVAAAVRPAPVQRTMWSVWIAPVATVAVAFLTGMVAGRVTLTDPDRAVLEYLPVIEHLDVLREAGSIEFLTAVARRNYPAPRRFGFGRPGEPGGDVAAPAYEALDASVAALTREPFGDGASSGGVRRDAFETGTADERRRVADAALEFQTLSPTQRRDLVRLARALGGHDGEGPDRDELLAAARLWHEWLATRDPAERKGVIDLDTAERLEWLDRYTVPRPGIGRGGPFRGFQPPGARLPEGPPPQGSRFNGPPPDPRRPAPGGTSPPPR